MTIENRSILKKLLHKWPPGMVATTTWLKKKGVNSQLIYHYLKAGWLKKVSNKAFVRAGDNVHWAGVVYALEKQIRLFVYVGGLTALELQGYGHFQRFDNAITLYGNARQKLPLWCLNNEFEGVILDYCGTRLFGIGNEVGLTEYTVNNFKLTTASIERAIMELLYQVPYKFGYEEAVYIMDSLRELRAGLLQQLLEQCQSIKVKRLFLHLAKECGHKWLQKIEVKKINLGKGTRQIAKGTYYDK